MDVADDLRLKLMSKVPVLPIFKVLEKYGQIKHEEMFEIFNMGVGLMLAETRTCGNVSKNFLTNLLMKSVVL